MKNEELKNELERYSKLKDKIKNLQDEANSLKSRIEDEMEERELDEIETDFGKFYMIEKSYYSYSDEVNKKKQEYKELQKEEKESGKAKKEIKKYLTYKNYE